MADRRVKVILDLEPRTGAADKVGAELAKAVGKQGGILDALPVDKIKPKGGFDAGQLLGGALRTGGPGGMLTGAIRTIGPLVGGLGKAAAVLGPVGIGIAVAAVALEKVGGKIVQFVGDMANTAISFAAKASPRSMERFQLAMDDVQAVIGRVFVPILDRFTVAVRLAGDVLASILPTTSEMEAVFRQLDPVFQELRQTFSDLAPLLRTGIVVHLQLAAVAMRAFSDSIRIAIEVLKQIPGVRLALALGQATGGGQGLADSTGASRRQSASFMGIAEFGKQFDLAAIKNSMAKTPDPPRESTQMDIRNGVRALLQAAGVIADPFGVVRGVVPMLGFGGR